jgi:PAS domain S-box-containing protein
VRQEAGVLFLSSSDPDSPDVATMIEQAQTLIVDGCGTPVHFSFEYVESSSSLADPSRTRETTSYLHEKYRGQTFQLVIVIGEETLAFVEQIRAKLFPDAALLFFVVNPQDTSGLLSRKPDRTGIIQKLNYLPTLQLALRQNPGTHHVIVVSGSSEPEKLEMKAAREQFRGYESTLAFQYMSDLRFAELGDRLARAQPDSIILFLDFETDSSGEQFIPRRILPAIAKAAKRPIYGTLSSFVAGGVVGGSVADLGEVGRMLGNEGVRILKGEKPENIPVTTGDFQHYVLDWRQLQRWGISEKQLPPDSVVLQWEHSPWELYRWRILGLATLLLIETLLIIFLLRNVAKRKRAQAALRRKEEDLAEAQRLARVGNWLWDPKTRAPVSWSEELYRIHGRDRSLPLPSHEEFAQLFTPASWARLSVAMEKALQTDSVGELELEMVRRDGSTGWLAVRGVTVRDAAGRVTHLRGTAQDITERKRAEQSLLESEKRFRLVANTAPVMIWTSGLDKLCDYFNQPWLDFTGRPLEAELGNGWAEGVHPEDLAVCLDTYTKAFDARQPFKMQYRLRRHDGEYRWLLDAAVPRFTGQATFAGYIGSCIDDTDRKLAEEALSTVGRRLIEAHEEERSRIARELHDDINQRLALLANRIQEFEQDTSANGDTAQKEPRQALWKLTNEIATDIQHMSHQLHPSKLHYLGLAATARDLCHEFSRQHKIEIECVVRDLPHDLEESASLSLFRTLQESLRNVVKHSDARHVKVELTCQSGVVRLRVSDDGIGFNPEHVRSYYGLGLVSMRERLRSVGGEFSIWSRPSLGTQVEGQVPTTTKAAGRAAEPVAYQRA